MSAGIYKITNTVNGKIYVGSSINLHRRSIEHFWELRKKQHSNQHLQNSFNMFGEDAFSFEVLEYVLDVNKLLEREQYYIDKLNACDDAVGYNICPKAGNMLGVPCSEERKQKISLANKGRKRSKEFCERMSKMKKGENHPFFGKKRPKEFGQKISEKLKGRKRKPLTDEQKQKMSESLKGKKRRPFTQDERERISNGLKKYFSENRCANCRRVRNVDTGEVYESVIDVERILNLPLRHSHIGDVCRGKRKLAYGYKWEYM